VDEVMRSLQGSFAQAQVARFRVLSVRMDMAGRLKFESDCSPAHRDSLGSKGIVMAK
jgi:hypothetical protein